MKRRTTLVLVLGLSAQLGCSHEPAASWGWSAWHQRFGTGNQLGFESQRATCLSQMGITDPEQVEIRSSQDVGYVQCMNAAGWCNQVWQCRAPTVKASGD
jgi:hypothetical protein